VEPLVDVDLLPSLLLAPFDADVLIPLWCPEAFSRTSKEKRIRAQRRIVQWPCCLTFEESLESAREEGKKECFRDLI
jgi:hypothetical protein